LLRVEVEMRPTNTRQAAAETTTKADIVALDERLNTTVTNR
jgi:hypothetical protein